MRAAGGAMAPSSLGVVMFAVLCNAHQEEAVGVKG